LSDSLKLESSPWNRHHGFILAGVLVLALVMRAFLLDFPHQKFFDEVYYVEAANNYLNGQADSNSVHPPLAKIQLAAGMLFFDAAKTYGWHHLDETVGWRLTPLLCGLGVVAVSAWLGYALSRRPRVALLTATLVAIEHLSVVESRIATLDSIQAFWITLGIASAAQRIFRCRNDAWIVLSALSLGIATGCKWNGLFAAAGVFLALVLIHPNPSDPERQPDIGRPSAFKAGLIFALIIPAVYALAYLPFSRTMPGKPVSEVVRAVYKQHERMVKFRYDPKQFKHQYLSYFYMWPFGLKPVWFHFRSEPHDRCTGIVAFGSVPFWWLSTYLLLETVAGAWRRETRDPAGQFLIFTYASQWLLWATGTTGGFFYYMVTVVPLMAVTVARTVDSWLQDPAGRRVALFYLAVVGIMALLYYPFMCGLSVPYAYFSKLFFVPGWIK